MFKAGYKIISNIGFLLLCYGLLWNDFHHLGSYSGYIGIMVKLVIFTIGFIIMNKYFKQQKLIIGPCLALIIIISGAIVGDTIHYSLPAPHTNSDWFADGID